MSTFRCPGRGTCGFPCLAPGGPRCNLAGIPQETPPALSPAAKAEAINRALRATLCQVCGLTLDVHPGHHPCLVTAAESITPAHPMPAYVPTYVPDAASRTPRTSLTGEVYDARALPRYVPLPSPEPHRAAPTPPAIRKLSRWRKALGVVRDVAEVVTLFLPARRRK